VHLARLCLKSYFNEIAFRKRSRKLEQSSSYRDDLEFTVGFLPVVQLD
jgi:hypothetical protein